MATKTAVKSDKKYFAAIGRRKTSIASVRLTESKTELFTINDRDILTYFPTADLRGIVREPFETAKTDEKFVVSAKIKGGGIHSQAEALRHGISRALLHFNIELRKKLKKEGLLSRDPRAKERRKFGLKKARRAPQWSKR